MTKTHGASSVKPSTLRGRKARARRYIRENYSLIVLHTLYTHWGLPTAPLRQLLK